MSDDHSDSSIKNPTPARVLFDPSIPLGRYQVRVGGRVIAEFDCDPDDAAEMLKRTNDEVQAWRERREEAAS